MFKSIFTAPKKLLAAYNRSLLSSPYKTKMATAGFTYFLADCICQNHIEKRGSDQHNYARSARQASVGAFFAAPSLHVWHSMMLPRIVKGCTRTVPRVLVSVLLNETVLAGYFVSCLLFSFEALKACDVEAGKENVKAKFMPAMEKSMKFWTGISFINYGLMPVHLRPVFVSCWSVVWQSYLSYVSNNQVIDLPEILETEKDEYDLTRPLNMANMMPLIP